MPAAQYVYPKSDDDVIYASNGNAVGMINVVAGENLTAGNIVFIKKNDCKVYQSGTVTADDIRADGVVIATVSSTYTAYVQTYGNYVTSGLSSGVVYYLSTSGQISATKSCIEVGKATSATNLFINIVQDDADPIGTVKHVLANITGVPTYNVSAFWTLADGTTVSDAESPINGQAVPDLNGLGKFIRSADTAGGTGGSDTMAHTHAVNGSTANNTGDQNYVSAGSSSSGVHSHSMNFASGAASNEENRPPYHNAIAIVKYK